MKGFGLAEEKRLAVEELYSMEEGDQVHTLFLMWRHPVFKLATIPLEHYHTNLCRIWLILVDRVTPSRIASVNLKAGHWIPL